MESKIAPSTNSDQPGIPINELFPAYESTSCSDSESNETVSERSYLISSIFPAYISETNSPSNDDGNPYFHSIQSYFTAYRSTSEISEESSTYEYNFSATTVGLSGGVHKGTELIEVTRAVTRAAPRVAFGERFAVLHDTVKDVASKVLMFKSILQSLKSTLDITAPIVNDIERLNEQLDLPEAEIQSLIKVMKKGEKLIRKCSKVQWWNSFSKFYYSIKLCELDEAIVRFCQLNKQAHSTKKCLEIWIIKVKLIREKQRLSCAVSKPPKFTVGLDLPMKELKTLLLKEEVQLLLLTAPGGCGKTTLVQMLCQDEQIKGTFKDNILFVNVSKATNVTVIVQRLFIYKNMQPNFQIQNDEDAIDQLPQLLNHIGPNPILLILDDVWLGSESLPEKFKLNIPNYKILVTSRTAFPRFEFTYNLKPLNEVDAMTLFCHSASLQDGNSHIPEEDIKKIVRGCGGFPLALKVIGCSLCGQPAVVWYSKLRKWSDGQFFLNSDNDLLAHLQKSLEFPNDKIIIKECFMDLGSFPEDQRIPIAALIDMSAELYELDEDGAIANLHELTTLNLASLVMSRKDAWEVNSCFNEDFVTQYDILRELALHQSSQEPIGQRSRLIMNISENNLPEWWKEQKQLLIKARLLSISTDELFSWSWCKIQAPNVEVLVLNFQTQNYTLPEFVEKMDKLKVLIVTNYGFFHAEISNFQLLGSLPNLKRIRLEKVSIFSLCKTLVPLKSLKKISLFMCNIGRAFENCTIQVSDALPNLTEISIDYSNDMVELPVGLCDIVHLKKLSITSCYKLSALPEGTKKLVNLEVLRLRSCFDLLELPESIRSLHKLRILDISDCLRISRLPEYIGELCNLKELNMKGCLTLRNPLPESTLDLEQLELVICDEERAKLWEPIKEILPGLKIVRICGGFPLALKVIGGSLCGKHPLVRESRLMDWSDGQLFFNSDTELLAYLQKSLEFPDDKLNVKECSMDLGSFPELEHFKNGKQKGSSSSKTIGTADINLMDDFVEMERIPLVSADKPFGDSHASQPLETELNGDSSELKGREIVPLSDSESGFIVSNQEIRSKDTIIGKVPGWLQDVLKVVLEQNRVTQRNPDEILEDIKAALVYINRPNLREVVDARESSNNPDASNPPPLNGYISWKPSNGHHIQMEELHSNVREENRKLREEFMNSESAKKDLEGRLQSATDKSESLMNQLLESEKTIVSLQTELETLKESKGRIEDHIGSQKLMNEDQDRQFPAARVELNEARHKFSSLEVELDNKNSCCKELEATCLELQLQLDRITKKKSPNHDLNQEEKQLRIDWEITAASEKLAECQEAILNMGKQLKALAAPREAALFDKVIATPTDTITTTTATARATTPSPSPTPPKDKSMNQHCSQMDQMLAADDAVAKALKSTKIKEIDGNSTIEDNGAFQPLERIPVLNGVKHEDDNNTAGSLAIVPTKKRGGGSFWRKPLWRKKKGNSKKNKNISSVAP